MIPQGLVILGIGEKCEDGILFNGPHRQKIVLVGPGDRSKCGTCGSGNGFAYEDRGICTLFSIEWLWANVHCCVNCKGRGVNRKLNVVLTAILRLPRYLEYLCDDS